MAKASYNKENYNLNDTKEESIRKFKQLLRHKKEVLERAKQYDGIDIYAKFAASSRTLVNSN